AGRPAGDLLVEYLDDWPSLWQRLLERPTVGALTYLRTSPTRAVEVWALGCQAGSYRLVLFGPPPHRSIPRARAAPTDDATVRLGAAVRRLRRARPVALLAERAGVSSNYWTRLEADKVAPSTPRFFAVAGALDVSAWHLLGEAGMADGIAQIAG